MCAFQSTRAITQEQPLTTYHSIPSTCCMLRHSVCVSKQSHRTRRKPVSVQHKAPSFCGKLAPRSLTVRTAAVYYQNKQCQTHVACLSCGHGRSRLCRHPRRGVVCCRNQQLARATTTFERAARLSPGWAGPGWEGPGAPGRGPRERGPRGGPEGWGPGPSGPNVTSVCLIIAAVIGFFCCCLGFFGCCHCIF